MQADPNCKRHATVPIWYSARFAVKPLCTKTISERRITSVLSSIHMRIPNATHICHPITRLPRMVAGEFSAAKTGIVDAFVPIPIPSKQRQAKSCGQFTVKAEPITEAKQNSAEMNMVPRRPSVWFKGCDIQQPLDIVSHVPQIPSTQSQWTYQSAAAKYGAALTSPRIHTSFGLSFINNPKA